MLTRIFTAAVFALLAASTPAHAVMVDSIGPTTNGAVLWIDPSVPNQNVPATFQTWGLLVTAPPNADFVQSLSIYAGNSGLGSSAATQFGIEAFAWSPSLQEPIGAPLYESPLVSFSAPNTNPPDPTFQIRPTVFQVNKSITPFQQYLIELVGNGAANVLTAQATPDAQLVLYQSNVGTNFQPFGNDALRTDITLSAVPLPAAFPLFGSALAGLGGAGWWKRRKVSRKPVTTDADLP
jgi:hypothetical protein